MRSDLEQVVRALLDAHPHGTTVSIDDVGAAIGTRPASADEIEAIFVCLEEKGRRVVGPSGARGEVTLRAVVDAARTLASELGRTATVGEISVRAGIAEADVRHALALATVIQR